MARLREDDEFRARVRAAVALQVPYSIFTGRIVGVGEPQWLPDDRDVALAWHAYLDAVEAEKCPMCGQPKSVCHERDLDGELYGQPVTCHFTAAVERTRKAEMQRFEGLAGPDTAVDKAGVYIAVYRRPPAPTET